MRQSWDRVCAEAPNSDSVIALLQVCAEVATPVFNHVSKQVMNTIKTQYKGLQLSEEAYAEIITLQTLSGELRLVVF